MPVNWKSAALNLALVLSAAAAAHAAGLAATAETSGKAGEAARPSGRAPAMQSLLRDFRSSETFFQERAEGALRRHGVEALPVLLGALEDAEPGIRLRALRLFQDILRVVLDDLDGEMGQAIRERQEEVTLKAALKALPEEVAQLKAQVGGQRKPLEDPEAERRAALEIAEKSQRMRAAEEALKDAAMRLPEVEQRLRERTSVAEAGRKRVLDLGPAAFGALAARREAIRPDLSASYGSLLDEIRQKLPENRFLPPLPAAGSPRQPGAPFERSRYLLSTGWAREVDQKGPLAARAGGLLERHLEYVMDDLRSADPLLRERAEEDLYALGQRGVKAVLDRSKDLPPGEAERVAGLLDWRIDPRVAVETGIDFRDYPTLPFRARRRMIIHYARVAGRGAIPTLRLIALDPKREPSLRVRLAAAESLAGPAIRDLSVIREFEKQSMPELLKIPEIARPLQLLSGIQLREDKRYAEAVTEFRKVLDETPYDFRANYEIAFAYLLMKNYAKAILHFEISRRVQPEEQLTLYNLACAYSLDGQKDKAIDTLNAAAKAGFTDFQYIEQDPDLAPLREDPRYHELVDRLRQAESGAPGAKQERKGAPDPDE